MLPALRLASLHSVTAVSKRRQGSMLCHRPAIAWQQTCHPHISRNRQPHNCIIAKSLQASKSILAAMQTHYCSWQLQPAELCLVFLTMHLPVPNTLLTHQTNTCQVQPWQRRPCGMHSMQTHKMQATACMPWLPASGPEASTQQSITPAPALRHVRGASLQALSDVYQRPTSSQSITVIALLTSSRVTTAATAAAYI